MEVYKLLGLRGVSDKNPKKYLRSNVSVLDNLVTETVSWFGPPTSRPSVVVKTPISPVMVLMGIMLFSTRIVSRFGFRKSLRQSLRE